MAKTTFTGRQSQWDDANMAPTFPDGNTTVERRAMTQKTWNRGVMPPHTDQNIEVEVNPAQPRNGQNYCENTYLLS